MLCLIMFSSKQPNEHVISSSKQMHSVITDIQNSMNTNFICDNDFHHQETWFINEELFVNTRPLFLPYFGKRKQVTYHPNLSYWCFHISSNVLFFQAKFHAETLILLRDMLGKDIMIFHCRQCKWQTNFALLQEISLLSLASFCQSRADFIRSIIFSHLLQSH